MKKRRVILAAVVAAGILTIGGVSAYLTDFDNTVNQFTVGKVDIELQEPGWKPDEHKKTEPSEDIEKDPQIKNVGSNDAYVYLEVAVPQADVMAADAVGNRLNRGMQELVSYTPNGNWTQLKVQDKGNNKVYTYAYNMILKPGETTVPLFQKIRFLNIVEGQLDGLQLNVPVRAYAIQTANTGDEKATVQEQARAAYEKYVNQNRGLDGKVTE